MFTARDLFDIAVKLEENGEHCYRKAMEVVSDPAVRERLEELADDELSHRRTFLRMKSRVKDRSTPAYEDSMGRIVLQSALGERAFSLEETDFDSMEDEETLLKTAKGFEEDSVAFYEILQSFVTDAEALEHLRAIVREERKHAEAIEEWLENLRFSESIKTF